MFKLDNLIVARHGSPDYITGEHLDKTAFVGIDALALAIFRFLGKDYDPSETVLLTSYSTMAVETAARLGAILQMEPEEVWQISEGKELGLNVELEDINQLLKKNTIMVTHGGQIIPLVRALYPKAKRVPKEEPGYAMAMTVDEKGKVTIIP